MAPRVVIITGCSTGVGRALAIQLAKQGDKYKVYATMRKPQSITEEDLPNLIVSALDVTSDESVNAFIASLKNEDVDVVVNNAGFAINGTHEQNTLEQVRQQFETNLFGIVRLQQHLFPRMRERKSGHLIAVSSVGGLHGTPFNDFYCASKFALEGYYESMAATNKALGIQTTLIEPGAIKTAFVDNVEAPNIDSIPDGLKEVYKTYHAKMQAAFTSSTAQTSDDVAAVILQAIQDGEQQKALLRYQTSDLARLMAKNKLVDETGTTQVNNMYNRFFAELA